MASVDFFININFQRNHPFFTLYKYYNIFFYKNQIFFAVSAKTIFKPKTARYEPPQS